MMKKNIIHSMILVLFSTSFLIGFYLVGIYILDSKIRDLSFEGQVEANALLHSTEHAIMKEKVRLRETEIAEVFKRHELSEPIIIAFAGDFLVEGSIERAMNTYGIDYPLAAARDEIIAADYAVVNLETAITKAGTIYPKEYNYRTGPKSLQVIKNAGFDMVSLANNHTMDFGVDGLLDTFQYLNEAGIAYIGAGQNSEEAYTQKIVEMKGRKIGFLGFSRVLPSINWYAGPSRPGIASGYQLERMVEVVESSKKEVDFLFVYMHWGVIGNLYPEKYQINDSKAMIDAGADAIVGTHPHVIQGLDYYKGKPIAYSIGNFLFLVNEKTAESAVLTFVIEGDEISMKFVPYHITPGKVNALNSEAQENRLRSLEKRSFNVRREGKYFYPGQ